MPRGIANNTGRDIAAFTAQESGGLYELLRPSLKEFDGASVLILDAKPAVTLSSSAHTALSKRGLNIHVRNHDEFQLSELWTAFVGLKDALTEWIEACASKDGHTKTLLIVDMSWAIGANAVAANMENWVKITDELVRNLNISVISHYRHQYLIDTHLRIALMGHDYLLGFDGIHPNPYWLPHDVLTRGTLRHHLNGWLNRTFPSLDGTKNRPSHHAAVSGEQPWTNVGLLNDAPALSTATDAAPWRVRCLGPIRIHMPDDSEIDWHAGGGATAKVKVLFAFLFRSGLQGADAELLCDLLWPDEPDVAISKNRLHHAIRCLRKSLSHSNAKLGSKIVEFDNGVYRIRPPEGSWIDLTAFEQFCRQSIVLLQEGHDDMALEHIRAADRLYRGDLFADVAIKYVDSEIDWCWSRRNWFREMYFKLQRDAARILRKREEHQAALTHCNKALQIDPACEMAHREAMLSFADQGRLEAVMRQFNQYVRANQRLGDRIVSNDLKSLADDLTSQLKRSGSSS